MKKVLNLLLLVCLYSNLMAQPPMGDSTFYYLPDGSKSWFYYQKDVAVFRYNGGVAYTAPLPSLVTSITWDDTDPHGYNIITWDFAAPGAMVTIQNAYIAGDPLFEYGFIPVTRYKNEKADEKKWYMGSDLINIKFKESKISGDFLDDFVTRNGLTLYHRPNGNLPDADTWTWVFRLSTQDAFLPFEACARIWFNEQAYISHCEPDMHFFRTDACTLPNEFTAWGGTAHPDALWHIRNNGNTVYSGLGAGTAGADAKICECWADGYFGAGVNIGLIDIGGYDYTHPDLAGQFNPGFDFINMTSFSTTHFATADEHGMRVAGVIGAIPNSGQTASQLINASAVGVSHGAKITPYIVNLGNTSVNLAVQQALVDNCDVLNMSWSNTYSNFASTPLYADLQNTIINGRGGLGMIACGSVGNDDANSTNWPAAMQEVIGVGATDENDFRGSFTQTNPWTWVNVPGQMGSNYISSPTPSVKYDVVAPGTDIRNVYTQNPTTSPLQTSSAGTGSSFSAPIVSGIAAIILEKYPSATYQQVTSMIDFTADKIKSGTTYNYSAHSAIPGYATQTFYGRVNCKQALDNPTVGMKETTKQITGLNMAYINENEALLLFNKGTNLNGFTVNIFDISGRQIASQKIVSGENTYAINTESLLKGVYLFNVVSSDNSSSKAFKYIK